MDRNPIPPPIATATVARLYMEQGKLNQAEALYHKLLGDRPRDPRLLEGLAQLRRIREAQQASSTCERVTLEATEDGLLLSWHVTAAGRQRAAMVLGREGRLVLRLVTFPALADGKGMHTIDLEDLEGHLTVPCPAREASLMAAAVGLADNGDRFISIAHCRPMEVGIQQRSKERTDHV